MLKIALPRTRNYVLGAFIFAFAFYTIINREFYFGIPALLLATGIITTYNYIALDFTARCKGEFTCLLGLFSLGGWEKLPAINHLFIKRFAEIIVDEINNSGVYQNLKQQRYLIMFSVANSPNGSLILEVGDLTQARKTATEIAGAGKLELKDYTT